MLKPLIESLKTKSRTIVFPEGTDKRILYSAEKLTADDLVGVILLGKPDDVKAAAEKYGHDISKCTIIDPETYEGMEEMVQEMVALRKGKMTEEQVRANLKKTNYFGTMLVKIGKADCLLGGVTYSTADTVRPALQLIKTKPGNKIVSSTYLMVKDETIYCFSDCTICISPNEEELAEIAIESAKTAEVFGLEPRVAMLSYSTLGSGKGESVTKMANATKLVREKAPDLKVEGEIQFDAAFTPEVAAIKCPDSPVGGKANVFIFPDISAGNIAYKVCNRMAGYEAIGPVLQGLNAPINDLSRGSKPDEVYKMAIITAALS